MITLFELYLKCNESFDIGNYIKLHIFMTKATITDKEEIWSVYDEPTEISSTLIGKITDEDGDSSIFVDGVIISGKYEGSLYNGWVSIGWVNRFKSPSDDEVKEYERKKAIGRFDL